MMGSSMAKAGRAETKAQDYIMQIDLFKKRVREARSGELVPIPDCLDPMTANEIARKIRAEKQDATAPGVLPNPPSMGGHSVAVSNDGNVGDVTSDARGTAARYNGDKVKTEYIPMSVFARMNYDNELSSEMVSLADAISRFEQGENLAVFEALKFIDLGDICAVFDFGAKKYKAWNWAKGFVWSVPLACIKRHWLAVANGEVIDPESGLPHAGHIGCNLVMLAHFLIHYPEGDDRPNPAIFKTS